LRPIHHLCRRARQQWIFEHSLHGLAGTCGWTINAGLACLLLARLVRLPPEAMPALLAIAAGLAVLILAGNYWRAPRGSQLARLVDERAGTGDLFASAIEFHRDPSRFGWLGELTCRQAIAQAGRVVLASQWSLGTARQWAVTAGVAVLLAGSYAAVVGVDRWRPKSDEEEVAPHAVADRSSPAGEPPGKQQPAAEQPAAPEKVAPNVLADGEETAPETPAAETVQITNEMIDRYLQQVPEEKVSLEGITPIRWDEDESTGKANPQNQRKEGEKIDPVKLDASLLKDLEAAKKTKEEGGKEGSAVDVVVMGKEGGDAAKGKSGGKEGKESLADAASKDPRGNPTRLAVPPARKGLQVVSAARSPSNTKGQVRPMGWLEFLGALRQAAGPEVPARGATPAAGRSPDEVLAAETVEEQDGELIDGYFRRLREADR
jgi:hypothetical protein